MCVNVWFMRKDTIRECGLGGVGVALVEAGFEVTCVQGRLSVVHVLVMLPTDQDVEISVPSPAPCKPAYHHASPPDDNELNL